ncbi:hypothetical protein [Desertimonas flava]|uniref:hypothetical protein n=1 Tax=Desertimonas flava TaxID=2064846 RepID=UPI000E34E6A8|nr:hypothetical protein [Desertimonas flava]
MSRIVVHVTAAVGGYRAGETVEVVENRETLNRIRNGKYVPIPDQDIGDPIEIAPLAAVAPPLDDPDPDPDPDAEDYDDGLDDDGLDDNDDEPDGE